MNRAHSAGSVRSGIGAAKNEVVHFYLSTRQRYAMVLEKIQKFPPDLLEDGHPSHNLSSVGVQVEAEVYRRSRSFGIYKESLDSALKKFLFFLQKWPQGPEALLELWLKSGLPARLFESEFRLTIRVEGRVNPLGDILIDRKTKLPEVRQLIHLLEARNPAPRKFRFVWRNAPFGLKQERFILAMDCLPTLWLRPMDAEESLENISMTNTASRNKSMKSRIESSPQVGRTGLASIDSLDYKGAHDVLQRRAQRVQKKSLEAQDDEDSDDDFVQEDNETGDGNWDDVMDENDNLEDRRSRSTKSRLDMQGGPSSYITSRRNRNSSQVKTMAEESYEAYKKYTQSVSKLPTKMCENPLDLSALEMVKRDNDLKYSFIRYGKPPGRTQHDAWNIMQQQIAERRGQGTSHSSRDRIKPDTVERLYTPLSNHGQQSPSPVKLKLPVQGMREQLKKKPLKSILTPSAKSRDTHRSTGSRTEFKENVPVMRYDELGETERIEVSSLQDADNQRNVDAGIDSKNVLQFSDPAGAREVEIKF